MTGLYVDSIKDASNTKTLATLSSSAVNLHSDVTVPASIGGTMVFLEKFTASNTNSKIFNLDSYTSYNIYLFEINTLKPVQDNVDLRMCVGTSSSDADMFDNAGNNRTAVGWYYYNGTTHGHDGSDASQDSIIRSHQTGDNTGFGLSATIHLYNPTNTSINTHAKAHMIAYQKDEYTQIKNIAGYRLGATDDAFVKFFFSANNIASGTITLYGIKDA